MLLANITRWNAMSGKQNSKINTTLKTFFVLMFFAIWNFFLPLKILFLAFLFFAILLFPIHATCGEGNSKTAKNENAKNKIFSGRKKIEIAKIIKTKNVLRTLFVILVSRHCIVIFVCLYPMRIDGRQKGKCATAAMSSKHC